MTWMISWRQVQSPMLYLGVMFIVPRRWSWFPLVFLPYELRSGFGPSFVVAKLCGSWRYWAPWWNFLSMCAIWIRHHWQLHLSSEQFPPGYLLVYVYIYIIGDCTAQLHRDVKIIICIVRIPVNQYDFSWNVICGFETLLTCEIVYLRYSVWWVDDRFMVFSNFNHVFQSIHYK